MLAAVLAVGALFAQLQLNERAIASRTRFDLPGFDAHVYVAMAEHPTFFTAAPWGYRVLAPWVVSALPVGNALQGFRRLNLAAFVISGVLLFLWLRSLGHGERGSLAAALAMGLLPPVAECLRSVALVDPLAFVLVLAFAVSIERRAPLVWLSALMACLALTKEIWPALVPLVALRRAGPWRRRLLETVVVAVPALAIGLLLHWAWVPHIELPRAEVGADALVEWLGVIASDASVVTKGYLMGGLTLVAAAGLATPRGRLVATRYGYLIVLAFAAPLVAWVNLPSATAAPHVGDNVLRLALYAAPWLLALALCAADLIRRRTRTDDVRAMASRHWDIAGAMLLAVALAVPFGLDRYRREPLHARRDGPFVATFVRESLRTARQLQAGRVIEWDLDRLGFEWGVDDPGGARHMRWFLRDGWGISPHYGYGAAPMRRAAALLIVPMFEPQLAELDLRWRVEANTRLSLTLNGTPLGRRELSAAEPEARWLLPKQQLYRGDNRVTLLREGGSAKVPSLERVRISILSDARTALRR